MLAISFLQWWYSVGWGIYFQGFRDKIRNIADFFSIGLLLRTLFQPFRQISANEDTENAGILTIIIDHFISRFIGFIIRFGIIIFGLIALISFFAIGLALGLLWPFVPLLPFAGIVLSSMGIVF